MSNFHKPKTYRSANGCCICRAKSSSSRFTDSKKYESEFESCFLITEKRSGEICNACVLLVKRWKKLPPGTERNWKHVVDARAVPGHGQKPQTKFKSKGRNSKRYGRKNVIKERQPESPEGLSDDVTVGEECLSDQSSFGAASVPVSLAPSPVPSEGSNDSFAVSSVSRRTLNMKKQKPTKFSSFIDRSYWKKKDICCGTVFVNNDAVLIDLAFFKPCKHCPFLKRSNTAASSSPQKSASFGEVSVTENSSNLRTKCLATSTRSDEMSSIQTNGDQPQPSQLSNQELKLVC